VQNKQAVIQQHAANISPNAPSHRLGDVSDLMVAERSWLSSEMVVSWNLHKIFKVVMNGLERIVASQESGHQWLHGRRKRVDGQHFSEISIYQKKY
jgi:hypothetical protein